VAGGVFRIRLFTQMGGMWRSLRGQFNALKALIDAISAVNAAQVDGVVSLPPGSPATVDVSVAGTVLHFFFGIPQGETGAPGEVTATGLANGLLTTGSNSNGVPTLSMAVNDPPTQAEVQTVADRVDELILALRRS
jgi:hypothetical protein